MTPTEKIFEDVIMPRVETPELTMIPPSIILIPDLAVIRPTESIFVTSSYVKVPPIVILPLNSAELAVINPTIIFGVLTNP